MIAVLTTAIHATSMDSAFLAVLKTLESLIIKLVAVDQLMDTFRVIIL